MTRWRAAVTAAAGALLAVVRAQGGDFSIPSAYTGWDNDQWVLSTKELIQGQYQSRLGLANGYLGCAQAAVGPFFEADVNLTNPDGGTLPLNGWPLDNPRQTFCTIAGFWNSQPNTTRTNFPWLLQNGGESVISGLPHWGGIILEVNGTHLDGEVTNTTIRDFQSSLSARHGVANWTYNWAPANTDGITFDVRYTAFVSRTRPNVAAIRADITPSRDCEGTITDLLDGRSAVRTTFDSKAMRGDSLSIHSAVHPLGLPNITAVIESTLAFHGAVEANNGSRRLADQPWLPSANESTIGQTLDVRMRGGQTATVIKYVGGASSDGFENPGETARNASRDAAAVGWDALLTEHQAAWEQLMNEQRIDDYRKPDGTLPEDPNVRDLQIISIMTPYYLLQNTLPAGDRPELAQYSISVSGLTGDSYAGFVFWDADLFMSPGMVVAHPEYARQIAEYRIRLAPQARINAEANGFSNGSVLYPWTSARFGNCTATGPCTDYQYHLNSDIAIMLLQHRNVTGDEDWWRSKAWPIFDGVAQMFSELLKFNETTQRYDIRNYTDPDEYANGIDNGAFTLASASKILTTANYFRELYGQPRNDTWELIADNVPIPYDVSGITVEYDGMNNSVPVKQADVVLNTYPLNYRNNYTERQSLNDLDYYSGKQSPDGPAMTYSILSIIANEVSPSGCSAYTYALDAFEPYTRAPWYQFSEQQIDVFAQNGGTNPAFPFLTGHGGFDQIGVFGWLGLRTDQAYMYIDPALPPQIPYVNLRTFYYGGATIEAVMNYTHTRLTRVQTNNTFVRDIYGSNPMPVLLGRENESPRMLQLSIGQTIEVRNRLYTSQLTVPNNLVQCLPATSSDEHRPGQYPLAAVDGAISTSWQPLLPERASMVVDLSSVPIQPIVGLAFNWGVTPPVSAQVILSNSSLFDGPAISIPIENITISAFYDESDVRIRPFTGNTTNLALASSSDSPVYSAKYVRLEIEGTQGPDTDLGAQVSEFSLIGASGREEVKDWQKVEVYRR
ncbi:MAG: hypothetical protein M1823_001896 [Watsoniomyces obsoletus]|nr:MAG: hypothetical protein M1823_001896 [Watsoniomyces obsoletus]